MTKEVIRPGHATRIEGRPDFSQTLETLKQPVEPGSIRQREGFRDRNGNAHLVEFVEWYTVADVLDRLAPEWSHSVKSIVQIGETVAVVAAITIQGVTREGVGTGTAENDSGVKKAEHDALKRAAMKFGIAREVAQRENELIDTLGAAGHVEPRPDGAPPPEPAAKALSMADLVTPKQLGMIRALAREAGVDPEEESQKVKAVSYEELSKRAASTFIDHLKDLTKTKKPAS